MNRNRLVESIFKLSDGQNVRSFAITAQGGIGVVNITNLFPEIQFINNRLVLFEDSVIYQQAPPTSLGLPTALDFDLNFIAVGRNYFDVVHIAVGRVTINPLNPGI